jgi:hypothetical protein
LGDLAANRNTKAATFLMSRTQSRTCSGALESIKATGSFWEIDQDPGEKGSTLMILGCFTFAPYRESSNPPFCTKNLQQPFPAP